MSRSSSRPRTDSFMSEYLNFKSLDAIEACFDGFLDLWIAFGTIVATEGFCLKTLRNFFAAIGYSILMVIGGLFVFLLYITGI